MSQGSMIFEGGGRVPGIVPIRFACWVLDVELEGAVGDGSRCRLGVRDQDLTTASPFEMLRYKRVCGLFAGCLRACLL